MAKTKQELEKEFEAYKKEAEAKIEQLKKRMLDKRNKDYMDVCLIADRRNMTIESLSEENEELKQKLYDLYYMPLDGPAYTVLKKDYNNAREKYLDLIDKYNKLATEHEELVTAHFNMSKRYGCLVCDNEYLKRENKDLKKELEEEKAKSKFIPLPPRPDYPALLKRYTDLQKDHEQLDKDFKDLYGRYEEQKRRIKELVLIVDDKYDTIWNLKTKLSEHENELRSLEHEFGIKAENIYDILNAWNVVANHLVVSEYEIYGDNLRHFIETVIEMINISKGTDPKNFKIVKKAMDIRLCQKSE